MSTKFVNSLPFYTKCILNIVHYLLETSQMRLVDAVMKNSLDVFSDICDIAVNGKNDAMKALVRIFYLNSDMSLV